MVNVVQHRSESSAWPWLCHVPEEWEIKPIHSLFRVSNEVNGKNVVGGMLSVSGYRGIEAKQYESDSQKRTDEDLQTYRVVRPGQLVVNTMWLNYAGLGISELEGHVSPAYRSYWVSDDILGRFAHYLLRSNYYVQTYTNLMQGIRPNSLQIKNTDFKNIPVVFPDIDTQNRIVAFLDEKTAEIDQAIEKKKKLIELLIEQKTILINNAVTKGLNPNVPMRDSGVDWIGEIPAHWEVKRAKYLFREVDERSTTGTEELLSVSHLTGVTPRSEKNVFMFMAEDYTGSKVCRPGDLVFNIMWAWMGALGVSETTGIVSPSYGVYRAIQTGIFDNWYLEHLVRSKLYVAEYNRRSTGLHSSRLRLYPEMFFRMELGYPPLEEQVAIRNAVQDYSEGFDRMIASTDKQIQLLTEYKQTLIANAVTGKIRV